MYSLHDIEIKNIPLLEILECEIESKIGAHSALSLLARVEDSHFFYDMPECQDIEVILHMKEEAKTIFAGIVSDIRLSEEGQGRMVRIEGRSYSWLMDREKHSLSFQNVNMSYQELVEEILSHYEEDLETGLIYSAERQETGSLFVQYNETDWEFVRRVLSQTGLTVTPDCRSRGLKLYAGTPALQEFDKSYRVLGIEKDMASYYALKAKGREIGTDHYIRYHISSEALMGVFDSVEIKGRKMAAYACRYSFRTQEMTGYYDLQSPNGLEASPFYPMHLIGVALRGKAVRTAGSEVQASLAIDGEDQERALYWFPYSTLSASSDGSGWYYMPETGDDIQIYFPTKQEKDAIALNCVSNYDTPSDGGADRMGDPNSRYLRTRAGHELAFTPDHIRLSCGNEASSVTINTDGKIIVRANDTVKVEAKEELILYAEQAMNIHAMGPVALNSCQGGSIELSDKKIMLKGTTVNFD